MTGDWVDFSRARLRWKLQEGGSEASFAIEALLDGGNGERWHLCSQVMAGNVYAEDMVKLPPYTFTLAASRDRWIRFRDGSASCRGDDAGNHCDLFQDLFFSVNETPGRSVTGREVITAVRDGLPLMGLVSVAGPVPALLRFPVKHINLHPDGLRWQAETGPLLCPSRALEEASDESLQLAFSHTLCYVFFRQDGACSALVRKAAVMGGNASDPVFALPVRRLGTAVLILPVERSSGAS